MRNEVVSDRYARALLAAVPQSGALDEVLEELMAVVALVGGNSRFKAMLEGPAVSPTNKKAIIEKALGGQAATPTISFLKLMIDRHRIDQLEATVERLQRLVEERRNQLRVRVTTAVKLSEDMGQRLKRALDARTDKDCILETRTDPRIVAGVVCVLDDQVIDGSLRNELHEMRKSLLAAAI